MDIHAQIQIVERHNSVTLCQEPDFLFWQQSPAGGADLVSAEAFANRLLALVSERRQHYGVRSEPCTGDKSVTDRFG